MSTTMEGANRDVRKKLVIAMVGLPARGKSYVSKKLCRYLNWLQYEVKLFNAGDKRRKIAGAPSLGLPSPVSDINSSGIEEHSANFFDFDNVEARNLREAVAMETLDDLLDYLLGSHGQVGVFDATNTTVHRRTAIVQRVKERAGDDLQILFLESQCFDKSLLKSNMRLKLSGPDYKGKDPVVALQDFEERVRQYEKKYTPIGEQEEMAGYSFCQMIDVGRKFITHNIKGYLATQTVYYLQHFNLSPRQIWLTRHGESLDDVKGKIGGNSDLSPYGVQYSKALSRFISAQRKQWIEDHTSTEETATHQAARLTKSFHIWTSNVNRSIQTAAHFTDPPYQLSHERMLDELNAGILDGKTREEIQTYYSGWVQHREKNKMEHRYPGTSGEGYIDLTNRLKAVILEVERLTDHVCIIGGLAVLRVLLAYFKGLEREEIADLRVPLGTVYLIEPKPYGVQYKEYLYDGEKDWFYPKEGG